MTKQPAKKKTTTPRKKAPAKKMPKTQIVAKFDVGFGNSLFIRGEGDDLSWEKGIPLKNVSANEWTFDIAKASGKITFKFLINDEIWAEGGNLTIQAGDQSTHIPKFVW